MTTNGTPVPPVSRGNVPKLPPSTTIIKQEQQELTNTTANGDSAPPQSLAETPDFINSLAEIRKLSTALSTALSAFYRRYGELQNHLKTVVDSKLPDQLNQLALIPIPETSPKPSLPEPVNPETEPDNTANSKSKPDSQKPNLKSKPESQKPNLKSKPESEKPNLKLKPDSTIDSVIEAKFQKPPRSELENLCESMCSRSLRRYITARLSDSTKLREEVPKALKFARNPPRLVLESVGRFYLQGRKAYAKENPMIEFRRASILILECFLLMGCEDLEIENDVEREAAEAAVAWRKRLVSEGGLAKAAEIDARGLLMLISGFGIPNMFTNEDIREVIMATKVKSISSALRHSSNLVTRIPSIVELMVKKNLEVKAADIAYSLGLEDKCSPKKILTTFLRHSTKSNMQGSSEEVRTAKKKQLADLQSIIRCLEAHKIDPSELLPESKIDEKITSLEKEITELDKKAKDKGEKAALKRKADETDTLKYWKSEDAKRTRFPGSNMNGYSASPSIIPHGFRRPEDITDGSIAAGVLNTSPYGRVYGQPPAGQMISQAYAGQSQSYGGQTYGSSSGLTSLYRPSHLQSSLEGFAGLPSHSSTTSAGVWNRGSGTGTGSDLYQFADSVTGTGGSGGSDLYRFADSVVESESYNTSSSNRAAHRSSYLY